jgi:acyl carrier protein
MDIETTIRDFILKELLYEDEGAALAVDESLFSRRVIDSVGLLRLVGFLEETYQIEILADDLAPEGLETIRRIADLVRRKQATASRG